jgi:hypothetical protein
MSSSLPIAQALEEVGHFSVQASPTKDPGWGTVEEMSEPVEPGGPPGEGSGDAPTEGVDRLHAHAVGHALGSLREQLGHLEHLVGDDMTSAGKVLEPAWRAAHEGENRLPVAAVVAVAVVLQVVLPARFTFQPEWVLPALEGVLLIALSIANPRRITRTSSAIRAASVGLVALVSLANGWSAGRLAKAILEQHGGHAPIPLLADGGAIYLTNIIVFALWYWEWDRGGPVARAQGQRKYPDFLFAHMTAPELAPKDWRPSFFDYFYLSFTNATAFSPTDTLPLAVWAKMLMMAQSVVALVTVALVVSHAVNILQ